MECLRTFGRVVVGAIATAALLASPGPRSLRPEVVQAQYDHGYCRVDVRVYNRTRRVTGDVNEECGQPHECTGGICHDPPWGNWGVTSAYGGRTDGDQFKGWKEKDGHHQWNSCTAIFNDPEHFNNGHGKQQARPDSAEQVTTKTTWHWAGARNQHTCRSVLPEVRTDRRVKMKIYELDKFDIDDLVTILNHGHIDIPITCWNSWDCYGSSEWHASRATHDDTGVSSELKLTLRSSFSH